MKYIRNPISGQVQTATPLHAKRMLRYGWEQVTRKEWDDYQQAKVQAAMVRHMPKAAKVLGRMQ
jgi:hypothetical protein